jgi:hypothetical protein
MFKRIISNPSEASGCIQSLLETVARRDTEIEILYSQSEAWEKTNKGTHEFIDMLLVRYMLPPWYRRVWNVLFRDWRGVPGWRFLAAGRNKMAEIGDFDHGPLWKK